MNYENICTSKGLFLEEEPRRGGGGGDRGGVGVAAADRGGGKPPLELDRFLNESLALADAAVSGTGGELFPFPRRRRGIKPSRCLCRVIGPRPPGPLGRFFFFGRKLKFYKM